MTQYAFYFDSSKCTGCKTCQVACKETYKLAPDNLWRRVYDYQGGSWAQNDAGSYVPDGVFSYRISMSCNHCDMPACMANCATGAISKDDDTGIVSIDEEACIGCKACVTACPYEVPTFVEETGLVTKCDMCSAEVAKGGKPLCVTACPMRALDWGDKDELIAKYGEGDVEIEPLPENTTGANLVIKPHPAAQKTGAGTGSTVNLEEEL